MSIKDWPVNERPRETALANGAHPLSDAELLAVLLGASGRRTAAGVPGFGNCGQFGARHAR